MVHLKPEAPKTYYANFEERLQEEIQHPHFGYRTSYRRCIELQVRLLAKYLLKEIPDYTPFPCTVATLNSRTNDDTTLYIISYDVSDDRTYP